MPRLFVIGIGYRPLDDRARTAVLLSSALFASPRLAEVFRRYAEFEKVEGRLIINESIGETFSVIKGTLDGGAAAVTLLASGDPLFHGIGRRVLAEFGRVEVEILPDLSCVQVAFARLGTAWDDALLISLHGGPDPGQRRRLEHNLDELPSLASLHSKIAILTDDVNSPAAIARSLFDASLAPPPRMYVCERLCYPEERVVTGTLNELSGKAFREPNVVVLLSGTGEGEPR
jgi:precorrin-6Y C5,15-methyltransferase (decarboxylating)